MSRQYFMDVLIDPPLASQVSVTANVETIAWNTVAFTPIAANDPRPGKIYRITAGGIMNFGSATATLIITPRVGTTVAGGATLGATLTQATNTTSTSQPWYLEFTMVCRSVGLPGANSGFFGTGMFQTNMSTGPGFDFSLAMGGTVGTTDVSLQQGFVIGVTLSTGIFTTGFAVIQSLN